MVSLPLKKRSGLRIGVKMPDKSPIILAVDTTNLEVAKTWIAATQGSISIYKIGLEFFLKLGSAGIIELRKEFEFELF